MPRYTWLVFTNATTLQDRAEFNRWYDDIHIPDLLRIPGVTRATRKELTEVQMARVGDDLLMTDAQGIGAIYQYLACYHVETDDVAGFLREVQRRANTEDMPLTATLGDVYTVMYQDR